jgi:putative transposase
MKGNNFTHMEKYNSFFPSSKTCSECNYIKEDLELSDREWICPECGVIHDRDINAARNIKIQGMKELGLIA